MATKRRTRHAWPDKPPSCWNWSRPCPGYPCEDQIGWSGDPDWQQRQATLERFAELINGDGGAVEGFVNERVLALFEELLQHRFHFMREAAVKALGNQGARTGLARACGSGSAPVRRIARSIGALLAVPQQHRP